jgi:hypothetical protein
MKSWSFLVSILLICLVCGNVKRIEPMALSSSLPQGTKLEQWDIPDLNKLLLGNGLAQIDVSNKDLLTKTIIYLDASGVSSISPATEVTTDWTPLNDGVCTQDSWPRSIQDKDGTAHLYNMTTGFYQKEYKNGTFDKSNIGAVVTLGGRYIVNGWRWKYQMWSTPQDYYDQCKKFANSKNATVFGLQSGEWCLVGNTNDLALGKTDSKYRVLDKSDCTRGGHESYKYPAGTGHHWKNMVYTRKIEPPVLIKFDQSKANAVLSGLRSQGYRSMEDVLRYFTFDGNIT